MEKLLKNRIFFNIFTLIFLTGPLFLPDISLADEFDDITLRETAKYLSFPESKVQDLIQSLINIFNSEWINLAGSGYITAEEMAVPSIMKKAVRVQALNHLLIDAPIETSWAIIKNTTKIARIFLIKDISGILNELEKESVRQAISYGMNVLLENDIRMSPGAIEFEYKLREGGIGRALIQYIMIYKPFNDKKGEMIVKFYSPNLLKLPKNEMSYGGTWGIYTELTTDLPPFIVDIRGEVEDYKWIGNPSMKIEFPEEVPDLGIKPLSLWEKYLLKPIETTIKEIEIIITKITGKSPGITDIWNEVKKFIDKIKFFAPAGLVETSPNNLNIAKQGGLENISNIITQQTERLSPEDLIKIGLLPTEIEFETEPRGGPVVTLEEIQEMLDDISERIDLLSQGVIELVGGNLAQIKPSDKEIEAEDEEEVEEAEDAEKIEEVEEIELAGESNQAKEEITLCEKVGQPARNKVIFNEIAWMGGEFSANDEWIELKNIYGTQIDLTGWQILDKENQIKIIFNEKIIQINGFLLLERTDDDSMLGIAADLIYTGALSNSDETLYLFDENCQIQDEVVANPNWPAGESGSKRTMERKFDLTWQISQNSGGTPKKENSSGYYTSSGGGAPPPAPAPSPSTPPKILITETQIETTSSTNYDFIELYNLATSSVGISGFQLKKRSSTGSEYSIRVFPENSIIFAQDYFLWANSDYASNTQISADATSSQTLARNNSIVLFDNNGNILDAVAWGTSTNPFVENLPFSENPQENQSLDRKWLTTTKSYIDTNDNQNDFEIQNPTPKTLNQSPASPPLPLPPGEPLLTVVVNETAWMGTSATNSSDEWVELYNNTTSTVDLTGWTLRAADGTPSITFPTSTISAQSYFLLERTDDTTVSDIAADLVYTGALSNDGEKLELSNASGTLIDIIDCSFGWFAGTTTSRYISMEKINSNDSGTNPINWANNNQITKKGLDANGDLIYGTPKSENSVSKSETEIGGIVDYPVLTFLGSPYIVINTLAIPYGATLTIEPDVNLKFNDSAGLDVQGILKAIGEENKKIIFTSLTEPSYWRGIYFTASSTNSELIWTEIKYSKVGIEIKGGGPTIKNSEIKNNKQGIFIEPSLSVENVPIIEGNNFEGNEKAIYSLDPDAIFRANTGKDNTINGILILGSVSRNTTWFKNDIPYLIGEPPYIGGNVNIVPGVILTIEQGTRIELANDANLEINGTLLAQGSIGEPIIFTAYPGGVVYGNQAPWKRIYFSASSTNSKLENVIVSQGGYYYDYYGGSIWVKGSAVDFDGLNCSDNPNAVCLHLENSTSTVKNSRFENNKIGLKIGLNATPTLENNYFANNEKSDIYWPGGGESCEAMATSSGFNIECDCCPY